MRVPLTLVRESQYFRYYAEECSTWMYPRHQRCIRWYLRTADPTCTHLRPVDPPLKNQQSVSRNGINYRMGFCLSTFPKYRNCVDRIVHAIALLLNCRLEVWFLDDSLLDDKTQIFKYLIYSNKSRPRLEPHAIVIFKNECLPQLGAAVFV